MVRWDKKLVPMSRAWVVDASPLILLAKVGLSQVCKRIGDDIIAEARRIAGEN